jgi:hypothetical protein
MPLVYDIDYSDEIAALPKHQGYTTLPARVGERYITLHYSGVNYPKTTHAGELQRILDEAKYQLNKNYAQAGKPPAYPDGLLYDVVILSDGTRVKTRARPVQLWHCGNQLGNTQSWAVHLMLGPKQDATEAQWQATIGVFADLGIPRANVVGHNEWPRTTGAPRISPIYTLLPGQSECPGRFLHQRLAQWRVQSPAPPVPVPPDPLRAEVLPGPQSTTIHCSKETATFYVTRGGFPLFGYPVKEEFQSTGSNNQICSILVCERAVIKNVPGAEPTHLALQQEAKAKGWI